jgi:hypothetical protein
MSTAVPPSRRSTFLRWVWRLALGVLVAVGLAALGWWWQLERQAVEGRADLDAAHAETEALDPRWRWEQILEDRQPLPAEQDSAAIILRMQQLLAGLPQEKLSDLSDPPPNRLRDADTLQRLEALLASREEAVALAATLIDHPHGRGEWVADPDSRTEPPAHVKASREAVWLLTLDSERLLAEGRSVGAARHIHAILHAGSSVQEEGEALGALVHIALRGIASTRVERLLAQGEPDEATLTRLQEHFAAEAAERPTLLGIRSERALGERAFTKWAAGKGSLAVRFEAAPGSSLFTKTLMCRGIPGEHAAYLRSMNRLVTIASLPMEKQFSEWSALERELGTLRRDAQEQGYGITAALTVPAVRVVGEAGVRDHALMLCTVTTFAVERYRRAKQRWPEKLDELVPAYLPAVPIDPYSGAPLRYRRFDDGVAVYSVSRNRIDDGGVKIASRHFLDPDADLGLRLWDPPHRRLPPLQPGGDEPEREGGP